MANSIKYVIGDVTNPNKSDGMTAILQCCNDIGVMGAGVAKSIYLKWPGVKKEYITWARNGDTDGVNFELGAVQAVLCENGVCVINIIGQHGIYEDEKGNPPVRYEAIRAGLKRAAFWAATAGDVSFHAPRLGAGLAGGKWAEIEKIIQEELCDKGFDVTIYDLEP